MESAVHTQLMTYLVNNKLINDTQFGYRKHRSTQQATTLLTYYIRKSVDNKKLVGAVFIDLSRAFDTISHSMLINKLPSYGIIHAELEWFTSYLFDRRQLVQVNNNQSEETYLLSGVPQGSLLGPLLFSIFFNDFKDCIQEAKVLMYADDTVIYLKDENIIQLELKLTKEMENVKKYLYDNELVINLKKGKTETMLFTTAKRHSKLPKPFKIKFNDEVINNTTTYTYLGNLIDETMTMNDNFQSFYRKASSRINLLGKIRNLVTADISMKIYRTMILPIMLYCSITRMNMTKTQLNRLCALERRVSRIIGEDKKVPCTANLMKKSACKLVRDIIDEKIENKIFYNYFELSKHSHDTRNNSFMIRLPKIRSEFGKKGFYFQGGKIYNDLPLELRNSESKSMLKAYFE